MAPLQSDAAVRQDVLATLARDRRIDARRVSVDVAGHIVILRGVARTDHEKELITELVERIEGVADVVNLLGTPPSGDAANRADAEIAREVRADLARHLRAESNSVRVEVRGGTVYLRGHVASLDRKWLAEEVAWWTAGVRDVVNEIRVAAPGDIAGDNGGARA